MRQIPEVLLEWMKQWRSHLECSRKKMRTEIWFTPGYSFLFRKMTDQEAGLQEMMWQLHSVPHLQEWSEVTFRTVLSFWIHRPIKTLLQPLMKNWAEDMISALFLIIQWRQTAKNIMHMTLPVTEYMYSKQMWKMQKEESSTELTDLQKAACITEGNPDYLSEQVMISVL